MGGRIPVEGQHALSSVLGLVQGPERMIPVAEQHAVWAGGGVTDKRRGFQHAGGPN